MKIILLQDVKNVGKKDEVKDVSDGFARNFLIAKGFASLATKEALKRLEDQKEIETKKAEEGLKNIQILASSLDGLEIVILVKTGEQEQLFESITAQKIIEKLKELNFEIKKSQIDLAEPIKELGEFPVKVHFEHNLEAEIKVIVTEEKQ